MPIHNVDPLYVVDPEVRVIRRSEGTMFDLERWLDDLHKQMWDLVGIDHGLYIFVRPRKQL